MFHSLLLRRATMACGKAIWLANTNAKAAEAQARADAGMDRLTAVLISRGYSVSTTAAGTPDLYDCSGWFDNTRYGAKVSFTAPLDVIRFLKDMGGALDHLNGPGTADISIKVRYGTPGGEVHFNPWLAGVVASHLDKPDHVPENAVRTVNA